MATATPPPSAATPRVLGLGSAGVDLVAQVANFPTPDSKIRTTHLETLGGGNAANTLTCLSRLGVPSSMVSKVGDDANGRKICADLAADGVDTAAMIVREGLVSPFTYVIVDREGGTRTCIHTPAEEDVLVGELRPEVLDGVSWLHLDGRHTLAAIELAKWAVDRGVPVSLDVEKERPGIRDLIPLADVIITNNAYPEIFAPEKFSTESCMAALLECGRASVVATTQGDEGALMMRNVHPSDVTPIQDVRGSPLMVTRTSFPPPADCRDECELKYDVLMCPAWPVEEVVDSTGAGDAFIGGLLFGMLNSMPPERALVLGTRVAALKIQKIGARAGLPWEADMEPHELIQKPSVQFREWMV